MLPARRSAPHTQSNPSKPRGPSGTRGPQPMTNSRANARSAAAQATRAQSLLPELPPSNSGTAIKARALPGRKTSLRDRMPMITWRRRGMARATPPRPPARGQLLPKPLSLSSLAATATGGHAQRLHHAVSNFCRGRQLLLFKTAAAHFAAVAFFRSWGCFCYSPMAPAAARSLASSEFLEPHTR